MTRPVFSITWRSKQVFNQFLISIGGIVGDERFDFLGRGEETVKVDVQSANERNSVRPTGWSQTLFVQSLANKRVDRVAFNGYLGSRQFFQRPPIGCTRLW